MYQDEVSGSLIEIVDKIIERIGNNKKGYWEIIYAKHPERFWSGSNKILQCAECQDKTCQLKRNLQRVIKREK